MGLRVATPNERRQAERGNPEPRSTTIIVEMNAENGSIGASRG